MVSSTSRSVSSNDNELADEALLKKLCVFLFASEHLKLPKFLGKGFPKTLLELQGGPRLPSAAMFSIFPNIHSWFAPPPLTI